MAFVPERGDIMHVDLNPSVGQEQRGERFVFVLSPITFNQLGLALVVPITLGGNQSRNTGFAVSMMSSGLQTQGVIQCEQLRTIDYRKRRATLVEKAPKHIIDEVLARAETLVK